MEQKRLMILGAGRGQVKLYEAAAGLGYHTIAASIPGSYPGLALADEVCTVDISDPEAVAAAAEKYRVDGVATCCLDTGIAALGYTCDKLGLTGLSAESARRCGDKLLLKEALERYGVPTARFRVIRTEDDLPTAFAALSFPLILKAVDLQGSRGIYICRDRAAVEQSFSMVMEETKKDYCILEEFIEGNEFGAQAMVVDGEILYFMPAGDQTFPGNTNIPVGHSVPYPCSPEDEKKIRTIVTDAIRAVGLNNCAVNLDLIERNGEYFIIELTGRIGANCLPELVSIYYDVPIYEVIARLAMGETETVRTVFAGKNCCGRAGLARMLLSPESGRLQSVFYTGEMTDDIREITFFVHPGDEIRAFRNSRDCVGQVVVRGEDLPECEKRMEKILRKIRLELDR